MSFGGPGNPAATGGAGTSAASADSESNSFLIVLREFYAAIDSNKIAEAKVCAEIFFGLLMAHRVLEQPAHTIPVMSIIREEVEKGRQNSANVFATAYFSALGYKDKELEAKVAAAVKPA